ncbi:hypothetical protein JHD50_03615 [Sulfurimonas sp. MAG313]|nr:hypothetical protein [Sulfurimonas sp. MAG313]MDF1880398.1 hypothetical protein [Sulfurimonas sp. MAG313]
MKFLVSKDLHSNPNFTLLLGFYALMMLFYFIGDLFYMLNFFGFSSSEVLSTLKGNPDEFIEPLSLLSLLEHFHVSLFLAILALFTTLAIVLRIHLKQRHKRFIILIAMSSLLLSFISLISTYFFLDSLVYSFIFFSLLWHSIGIYALIIILKQVWFK